jgi:hypothetical protein
VCLREIWKIFHLRKNMHAARHVHVHIHVRHSVRIGRLWMEREPGTKWKAVDGLAEDISRAFIQSTNQNVKWR